jgi:hypothetical protein
MVALRTSWQQRMANVLRHLASGATVMSVISQSSSARQPRRGQLETSRWMSSPLEDKGEISISASVSRDGRSMVDGSPRREQETR